uniref:Charged multivesicular body protein 2Bb n=1 Tax=Oncorhynchus mykiss TaxID=8022 RepID=A0A8K9XBE9_ONCMY
MAGFFKKKTVDDVIKEQTKELRGTQRQITRDRSSLEKQEKQLEMEIKKMAKMGNKEACTILAKQLVQLRRQKNRSYAVGSKVTSMSSQTKLMNSQMKMAGAMATTTKTMQAVNKKMDPQKMQQTMQNFQKENMKMEMSEELSKTGSILHILCCPHDDKTGSILHILCYCPRDDKTGSILHILCPCPHDDKTGSILHILL